MRKFPALFLVTALFLAGCKANTDTVSAIGRSSPTPFQPSQENASDSLYAGTAPTPVSIPEIDLVPTVIPTETVNSQSIAPSVQIPPTASGPVVINPLTGLPASDPELLNRHPMAIKIANYPRYIRPQSGLSLADQAFEYYIEGGLTRFIAVLYGNDSEWVGPVRSGRFFDENIARMYQAFLVFKFADPRVLDYFRTTDIAPYLVVPSVGECPPYHFMKTRKIEDYNNNYFDTTRWGDCVEKHDLPADKPYLAGFFSTDLPTAPHVDGIRVFTYYSEYSYNYWEYSQDIGEYLRYQETDDTRNGKEEKYAMQFDNVNGQPIHAANVVVLFAYHSFANPFNEDDEVFNIDLSGSGEAYVFRDGIGIPAKWNRIMNNQPLTLTAPDGTRILLRPGMTFYEVVGTSSYASQGDGEWFFHHATP